MAGGRGGGAGGGDGGTGYTGKSGSSGQVSNYGGPPPKSYGGGGGGGAPGYLAAGSGGPGYGGTAGGAAGRSSAHDGGNGANHVTNRTTAGGGGGGAGFAGGSGSAKGISSWVFRGGAGGNGGTGAPIVNFPGSVGGLRVGGAGGGGGAGGAGFYSQTPSTRIFQSTAIGGRGGDGGEGGAGRGAGGDGGTGLQVGVTGPELALIGYHSAEGGDGGSGSGGSFGGAGIRFTDTSQGANLTNYGSVAGGTGGYDFNGIGGIGGAGVVFAGAGSRLVNAGSIQGGAGGRGTGGTGAGGTGVTGAGLTIANNGVIAGGMGATRADAITFLAGPNKLALGAGSSIVGDVDIQNDGSVTFDQSALAGAPADASLAANIIGSGTVIKVGSGVLTLSGTNTYTDGTFINAGTLAISADANLGAGGTLFINNGATLETTAGFASNRQVMLNGSATIQVDTGTLLLGNVQGGGRVLTKSGSGTLELGSPFDGGATIASGTLALDAPTSGAPIAFATLSGTATATLALDVNAQALNGQFASQLVNFNASSVLDLKGYTVTSSTYANGTLTLTGTFSGSTQTVTETYNFANPSAAPLMTTSDGNGGTFVAVCYASGTRIRTTRGDVAVEDLRVGELVVTASGARRPIRWLGHRKIDCRRHPRPYDAQPIRIAAQAFGPGLPARDLVLSPGHPVLVGADADNEGGHLVPIMCLINGTTIERVPVDSVTYWHVELDAHDILLAEGLPAESYLDWGDRRFFSEAADHALANPDFVVPGLAGRCRPVAIDGPVVEAERRRLDMVFATRLAAACHWPGAEDALYAD